MAVPVLFRWRDWPWAAKLAALLVTLAIVPLVIVTLAAEAAARRENLDESRARNLQRARNTAALLDGYLGDVVADVRILAGMPATVGVLLEPGAAPRRAELQTILGSMQATKQHELLFVLDYQGVVVAATDPAVVGGSRMAAPFFLSAMAGQTRVHDPQYIPADREVHVHASVPVRDAADRILGVAAARTSLSAIDRLVAGDSSFGGLGEAGLLWDERGVVISAPARSNLRFRPLGPLVAFTRDRLIAEQRYGPETSTLLNRPSTGGALVEHSRWQLYDERRFPHVAVDLGTGPLEVTSVPMEDKRWTYGIAVPQANVFAAVRAQSRRNFGVALVTAMVAVALAVVAARRVSRPLKRVGDAARALAAGDMTERVRLARRDEIGRMAEAFDAMADALAGKDAELRRHAGSLERRVQERTAELRGLLEAIPDLIFKVGRDGRLLDYVAAKTGDLAMPPADVLGRHLAEVVPADVARPALDAVEAALAGGAVEPFEYQLRMGGELREYEARVSASGPDAAVFLVRDVTDRRRSEAQLQFLARAGAALASSLDYGNTLDTLTRVAVPFFADLCVVDLLETGRLRCAAATALTPEREALVRASRLRYPVMPESDHPVARTLRFGSMLLSEIPDDLVQAVAQSSEHEAMMRAIGAHSAILVPLVARGQALGVLSFSRTTAARRYDSRDLQTAEELAHRAAIALENARLYRELQDSNRLKDEFLGIVSHELRTPLNAVLGWTQVLRRGRVDPEQAARALEAIDRNARAQAQLVDDLLDTSRVISGKLRIDIKPIDVGPVVESAVESFKPAARARGVELEAHIAPGTPRVAADAGRFQQIIGNLLSNALKFTPPGGRVVTTVIPSGPQVEVRVTDTGIGIAADFLPFVFDRFRQADSTTTRRHGGLGIGLAIVRHLVDLHGGTIRAESGGENRGSTFVVLLPAAPAGVPGEGGPSDLSVRPSLEDRGEPSAT